MRRVVAALVVLTAVLAAATTVHVPAGPQGGRSAWPWNRPENRRGNRRWPSEKLALAQQILQAREDLQQRGPLAPAFWSYWTERLTSLSLSQLQGIVALGHGRRPRGGRSRWSPAPSSRTTRFPSLGDSSKDLVYTKVAPCRVADTRVAGGILGTGASRSFYVAGLNLVISRAREERPVGFPWDRPRPWR